MKTHKKLFILCFILITETLSFSSFASVAPSPVDSIYDLIKNDWYEVQKCISNRSFCDSVYSTTINHIERINNSDTIIWTKTRSSLELESDIYIINYKQSLQSLNMEWMLSSIPPVLSGPNAVGQDFHIQCDGQKLSISPDLLDASTTDYSRTMRANSIGNEEIDSISNILSKNWYDVFRCAGLTGQCDSVYSSQTITFSRIAATDSILMNGVAYLLFKSNDNMFGQEHWMICNFKDVPSPDSIHTLPAITGTAYVLRFENNHLWINEDYVIDGESILYRSFPRTQELGYNDVTKAFSINPNPVKDCFSINAESRIKQIFISNINGMQVFKQKGDYKSINISSLPTGIYLLHIISDDNETILKLIKE